MHVNVYIKNIAYVLYDFCKKQNITFYRENKTQNRVRDAKT